MKLLDIFCGLGGWSNGFAECGFKCIGVDIVNVGYPYELILADVSQLNPKKLKFDVIVGSPPCRDFSKVCNFGKTTWKVPPSPDRGLINVKAFLELVAIAKPKYWILENVPGLNKHIDIEPQIKGRISRTQYRYFWGEFPQPLLPEIHKAKKSNQHNRQIPELETSKDTNTNIKSICGGYPKGL